MCFVALQSCLGKLSVFHRRTIRQTNMAHSDTDDDIIISSALFIASMLYQQIIQKHKSTTDM